MAMAMNNWPTVSIAIKDAFCVQSKSKGHAVSRFSALTSTTGTLLKFALIVWAKFARHSSRTSASPLPSVYDRKGLARPQSHVKQNGRLAFKFETFEGTILHCVLPINSLFGGKKPLVRLSLFYTYFWKQRWGFSSTCLDHEVDGGSDSTNGAVHECPSGSGARLERYVKTQTVDYLSFFCVFARDRTESSHGIPDFLSCARQATKSLFLKTLVLRWWVEFAHSWLIFCV